MGNCLVRILGLAGNAGVAYLLPYYNYRWVKESQYRKQER